MSDAVQSLEQDAVMHGAHAAQACAITFASAGRQFSDASQREAFVLGFIAACSGMAEQYAGHNATREAFAHVAKMGPARATAPTH